MITQGPPPLAPCLNVRTVPTGGCAGDRLQALPLRRLLRGLTVARVEPIFPEADLEGLPAGCAQEEALSELLDWHRVHLYDLESTERVYRELYRQKQTVAEVHRVPISPGPPGDPFDYPSGTAWEQSFRKAGPRGVGAEDVVGANGANGAGVYLADIEAGWELDGVRLVHPDLPSRTMRYGGELNAPMFAYHGIRVVGILSALHQPLPVDAMGLVPNAIPLLLLGNLRALADGGAIQTTDTQLGTALFYLRPGDVVLVEAQTRAPVDGRLLPAEAEGPVFAAIRACVRRGITVVAAAGNGGSPLSRAEDSGSILVAGGRWQPATQSWTRPEWTNYGRRIDCFAEGEHVTTTGINMEAPPYSPDRYKLTTGFSGTSSAAAIIAGVAVSVQGMVRATFPGARGLQPEALRKLLSDPTLGTEANDNSIAGPQIGVMPDLAKLAKIIPDLPAADRISF